MTKIDVITELKDVDQELVQLYNWLPKDEIPWLQKELTRILLNESRTAVLVKRGGYYSVFVNDVSVKHNSDTDKIKESPEEKV